jgi:hypothetical protein
MAILLKPPLHLFVERLQTFWFDHWKWITGTTIAAAGVVGHLLKR